MRILIDILHPAHVHFFRNFVNAACQEGHEVLITARDKDVTISLLQAYSLDHRVLSTQRYGTWGLASELAQRTVKLIAEARRFRPHVMLGIMGPCIALAGALLRTRVVAFYDNESAVAINRVVHRLSDAYLVPAAFRTELGEKLIRYAGYHELAYLHPRWFTPDHSVPLRYGISETERLSIVRFVGYDSSHDYGEVGFSEQGKRTVVRELAAYGRVLISSESPLPVDLQHYAYDGPVEDMHHLLSRADLFVGESSTMASEAVILGTHAVYLSKTGRGINDEQAKNYSHARFFSDAEELEAIRYIRDLCRRPDLTEGALIERDRLLRETCDLTSALLQTVRRKDLSAKASPILWRNALRENFSVGSSR